MRKEWGGSRKERKVNEGADRWVDRYKGGRRKKED